MIVRLSLIVAFAGIILAGCSGASKSQKGAVIGAAGGGVVGAVVGKIAGNTALGAIVGATVGGVAGAVIGEKMDKQAEEMKEVLGDADVRREGEGIVVNFKEQVLFGFDQAQLNTSAEDNLDKLVNVLQKYPETNIQVIGHTDSRGSEDYNQKLSEQRANRVVEYLKNHGIASSRLSAKGMGEMDPIASNETDEGRAKNRRVEFVITANEKMKAEAKSQAGQ